LRRRSIALRRILLWRRSAVAIVRLSAVALLSWKERHNVGRVEAQSKVTSSGLG